MKKFFGVLTFVFLSVILGACKIEKIEDIKTLMESVEKLEVPNLLVTFKLELVTDNVFLNVNESMKMHYDFEDEKNGLVKVEFIEGLLGESGAYTIEVKDGVILDVEEEFDLLDDFDFIRELGSTDIKVHEKNDVLITFEIVSNVDVNAITSQVDTLYDVLGISEEDLTEAAQSIKVYLTLNREEKVITKLVFNATDYMKAIMEKAGLDTQVTKFEASFEFSDYNNIDLTKENDN